MLLIKKNEELRVLEENSCIRYLYTRLEEIATDHLHKLQRKIVKNSETNFVPYEKHKLSPKTLIGFYMVAKRGKITIYWKFQNRGYLYNSYSTKKIVSFFIVKPQKTTFISFSEKKEWEDRCSFKNAYWDEIHFHFKNLLAPITQMEPEFREFDA